MLKNQLSSYQSQNEGYLQQIESLRLQLEQAKAEKLDVLDA